jgi:hypothetical protein
MTYEYYYNRVPGNEPWRNNLIYTSLISTDKTVFVQWYHNDSDYHKGQNQVVDPKLMDMKWDREVKFLSLMHRCYPEFIPEILDIDINNRKIYLKINGVDFWQNSLDNACDFDKILPDWQEQMLEIFKSYKELRIWKYSLHPSSYFVINGELKSINYFFTYQQGEGPITVAEHLSHISEGRQQSMKIKTDAMGISWNDPQSLETMQQLALESFRNNYPSDFIEKAKHVFL